MTNKLNDGHYVEALERLHLLMSLMEDWFKHRVLEDFSDQMVAAQSIIADVYQRVGSLSHDRQSLHLPKKFRPCPRCKRNDIACDSMTDPWTDGKLHHAQCQDCGICTQWTDSQQGAIDDWNYRPAGDKNE